MSGLSSLFSIFGSPVRVDIKEVFKRLDLENERFRPDTESHAITLQLLNRMHLRSGNHYGNGYGFFRDWTKKVTEKPQPRQLSDEPDYPPDSIRSSACVMFTTYQLGMGRRAFAMAIRMDASSMETFGKSMVFGLFGTFDKQDRLSVNQLIVPSRDAQNRLTEAKAVKINENNVRRALLFAELCAKNLYNGQSFGPGACLSQAFEADLETATIRPVQPQP